MNGRAVGAPIVFEGNSFGANTPATRGFAGQTTRPFGSGGAKWNLVNEGAVGTFIFFVDVAQGRSLGHIFGLWKAKLNTFPEK